MRGELAHAFRLHRAALADELFEAIKESEWSTDTLPAHLSDVFEWWRYAVFAAVDLAGEWVNDPDELLSGLFAGWIFNLDHPLIHPVGAEPLSAATVLRQVKPRWAGLLEDKVSTASTRWLIEGMDRLIGSLSLPIRARVRGLFIGDCFINEIMACLAGLCARAQIAIEAVQIAHHVPAMVRQEIRAIDSGAPDIVFYSPFSYTFAPEYGQMLSVPAAFWSRTKLLGFADEMLEEVALTVRSLAGQFPCPIYVHNTAGVVQSFEMSTGLAKNLMSFRNRRDLRPIIRQRINRVVADSAFEGRTRLLDEESLRRNNGDFALGRVLFRGAVFHPTRLSIGLARGHYLDAIATTAFLATKKVVVCDLDNTLWEGVIGEGPVKHLIERQQILKGLRSRGILLSINSKNDPANINFSGAALQMDDFVAPRISWEPKTQNMAEIIGELNLKEKDFVFVDDRPDELERIRNAFPAMIVLDARENTTWNWLAHWEKCLPTHPHEDRTRLYHERAAREQFLACGSGQKTSHEDEVAALTKLQLSVRIKETTRMAELKRAVELVNRTNQFNLCGSRVTLTELEKGLGKDQRVMIASAEDKFGSMGIVGVAVVKKRPEGFEIPVFVLSCRVFGFGIEYALLNALAELAPSDCRLVALYRETPHNELCRLFYAKAGLQRQDTDWVGTIADLVPTPSWLVVDRSALARS